MGKRIAKVPVILQMEDMEDGVACLNMILAYYKKWISLDIVRKACGMSRDGVTVSHLIKASESFDLICSEESISFDDLKTKRAFPLVTRWRKKQFVVLEGFKRGYVQFVHPKKGRMRVNEAEFRQVYKDNCLNFKPAKEFIPEGKKKTVLEQLNKYIKQHLKQMILVLITGFLAAVGGIISPVFSKIFTDDILSGYRPSWYPGILYFFAAVILFMLIASVIHRVLIIRSTGRAAVLSNANYMRHLFRLPIEFFSRRRAGDLSNRQDSNDSISETLMGEMGPLLINMLMLIFYVFVMFQYSIILTFVGIATIIVNLLVTKKVGTIRREISATQFRSQADLDSATVAGIDMMESIKATGSESGYFEHWSGYHAAVNKARVRFDSVAQYLLTLPSFIQDLSGCIILFLGFWLILEGNLTAGLLLAFLQFMKSLMNPVNDLLNSGEKFMEMGAQMDRIDDVMDCEEEVHPLENDSFIDFDNASKLKGHVEIKNLSFGYSKFAEPVIDDFSMELKPGKSVALVGGSGSGKSTIAKLLTGLYKPWKGEILFDGKKIDEIPRLIFKSSLTMVDQEITIFNDTIENNIRMWDPSIEDYDIRLAARDARIHDVISATKDGYHMMLREGGRNLSGGERQRIEIARALSDDPSIIIMDEATSALDAKTEQELAACIRERNISCVIVAHRLSTIRDCDEIIVLDKGKVVQRGTHDDLIKEDGLYKNLIMSD